MRPMLLIVSLLLFVVLVESADARPRLLRRNRGYSSGYTRVSIDYGDAKTDQEMAQKEAEYMARHRIFAHVGVNLGHYEGWGYGGRNCSTCVPRGNLRLTADAYCDGFRVRVWRH